MSSNITAAKGPIKDPRGAAEPTEAKATPYDGPLFLCDVSPALYGADGYEPAPGVKALLGAVEAKGIPIIYLGSASKSAQSREGALLDKLPHGVVLERSAVPAPGTAPHATLARALATGDVLAGVKNAYPHATLFALGDRVSGDAAPFIEVGARAYLQDPAPGTHALPTHFKGVTAPSLTPAVIQRVSSDLDLARGQSGSFGSTLVDSPWLTQLSATLDRVTHSVLRPGNDVEPLVDGENVFPQVIASLDQAKHSILYETFMLADGQETSNAIADRLIAAKARGVDVRMVVDAFGAREFLNEHNSIVTRLRKAGVEVQLYNPIDSPLDANIHRDHRKAIVIDGQVGFMGGMNTGDRYLGRPGFPGRYHDVFAKLTGPIVTDLAEDFASSWKSASGKTLAPELASPPRSNAHDPGVPVRMVEHIRNDSNIRDTYLVLIRAAKKNINLENSFPLTNDLKQALEAAARRGVTVNYIVSDMGKLSAVASTRYRSLLKAGVHIFTYPDPVHTKAISVDGQVSAFGSSNVDNVSLSRNRELFAVIEDPGFTRKLDRELFLADLDGSPRGKATKVVDKNLNQSFLTRLKNQVLTAVWPDTMQ